MSVRECAGLRVVQVRSKPAHVHGGARAPAGWFVLLDEEGRCTVRQTGREASLDAGELSVIRADERYELDFEHDNRMCVVGLPLRHAPPALDRRLAIRHPREGAKPVQALLGRLARPDATALDAATLARAFVDLVTLAAPALLPPARDVARGRRPAWLARLQALVDDHLDNPELDAAWLARALGISPRYVQQLFARQGTTVGAYITSRRLELAGRRLREGSDRITDVALQCGFDDLGRFCRLFRRRYGCTAGDWRASR